MPIIQHARSPLLAVLLVVLGCAALSGCSQKSATPTCASLVGKTLPSSVASDGCMDGHTMPVVATFQCTNGSTLVEFPGDTGGTYYWAKAGEPVKSGTKHDAFLAQTC